ncbi:UDP-glucose 4-epimerase GalE [Variovorax sp. J22R133]|uniref:UDP-glucose 4-epimerase GalE n=1 Tax=Variovorax brevis TaxID=3053503 RepID=UPI00257705D9|nr:UDP-glucose 4-epimerase GalE [Variovorax sp. J22R133]MDM0114675.1 UDP-glucose 4-epimerase GalE [Variovorax sp. J22R133]
MKNCVLVTGGAGYIGSHTVVALAAAGYEPLILDNFCNSDPRVVERLSKIMGMAPRLIEGDIRDRALLDRIFREERITAVIHFAALKAVGDSVSDPHSYYENNVNGTLVLTAAMAAAGVKTLVFSSSATVYGVPERTPIAEDAPCGPTNPYGQTKWMVEQILRDLEHADPEWRVALLRYFNPVGAHESGLIGEQPKGRPNNLMPFVSQVAVGLRECLSVHGSDYPTPDGTGVRDYVHVLDLADGHVAALQHLEKQAGVLTVNLGTGQGASVLQLVAAFERASGKAIRYELGPRRPGDVPTTVADPTLARTLLGWQAKRGLDQMCEDSWRWQSANPRGYEEA